MTAALTSEQSAILRLLLAEWLKGTAAGRAILAEIPEPLAVAALIGLQRDGLCRFVVTGDLDQDRFGFEVQGLPGLEPLAAAAGRVH